MATDQNIVKAPPKFRKSEDNYEKWKKKFSIWQSLTSLDKTKQGPALVLTLDDETQDRVLELAHSVIASESGVAKILEVLDKMFLKDKTLLGIDAVDHFESYVRGNESITEFINEFDRRYAKTKSYGTKYSEDVIAFRLLKSANLSHQDFKLIRGTVKEWTYENMQSQLKNVLIAGAWNKGDDLKEEVKVEEGDHTLYANQGRPQSGYNQRMSRPYRGTMRGVPRGGASFKPRGTNPLDQTGKVSTCLGCGSRYHWVSKCPEKVTTYVCK